MPNETLKIVIPMAGYGKRLRPHTWSKPKPLVSVAGKTVLGHVLDLVAGFAEPENTEIVFIVGYQGDQVRPYMEEKYPAIKAHYFVQEEMKGQSHAIAIARDYLNGPTLVLFVDTIIDTDFSFLKEETAGGVIWVKEVEDPRRFGVVKLGQDGYVESLIEKPDSMENNLAIVGNYYFARGEDLLAAIDHQIESNLQSKGEFYLADAIAIMIQRGLSLRPKIADVWLDAGLPETVLDTNRYLLDNGRDNTGTLASLDGVELIAPVFVDPSAVVRDSVIGPHVSVGAGCEVTGSKISDSVLEPQAKVHNAEIWRSLVGQRAQIEGVRGIINIGDDAEVKSK